MRHENYLSFEGYATDTEYLDHGKLVFTIIQSEEYTVKDTGEVRENKVFLDCEAYGKYAEVMKDKINKGDHVKITGRLKQDEWTDKETGKNRKKIVVALNNINILTTKEQRDYLKTMNKK